MGPILYGSSRIITRIGVIAFGSPSRWGLALGVQSHTSSDGMTVGFWKTKRMFPKMVGFPPKSSILIGFFHYKPSILGYPYFWKHLNLRRTYAEPTPWLDLPFFVFLHVGFGWGKFRFHVIWPATFFGGPAKIMMSFIQTCRQPPKRI